MTATSPRVRLRRGSNDVADLGTMLARRAMRKNVNKKAQNRVDERGSPSNARTREMLSKMEGVTGGALHGVCKALRAMPRNVRERINSFVKG